MSVKKKIKLKGKALAKRLTGISSPIAGISWIPPADEQDIAKRLITFLEDRRVLFQPFRLEVEHHVIQSIFQIRERLTQDLELISRSSVIGESLTAMRSACRKFCTETERLTKRRHFMDEYFLMSLGELRAIFGIHVTRLACAYDLTIENDLASILPAESDDIKTPKKRTAKK